MNVGSENGLTSKERRNTMSKDFSTVSVGEATTGIRVTAAE